MTLGGSATNPVNQTANYGGTIAGPGGVIKNGGGTQVLSGSNTYSGGTTINAGTLQIGNGGARGSISGNIMVNAAATLAYNLAGSNTITGQINGSGTLLDMGSGTLILAGTNNYGGAVIEPGAVLTDQQSATRSAAGRWPTAARAGI